MKSGGANTAFAGGPFVTSDLAARSPHIRSTVCVQDVFHWVLIATVPCVLAATYNTGLQVLLATTRTTPSGWQTRLLQAIGIDAAPDAPLDCLALGLLYVAPLFATVWLAARAAEWGFAKSRRREADHSALLWVAVLFALSLPANIPMWQAALGAAVAVVMGKDIFGGVGRGFVHPVVVGLAFLYFAYPGSISGDQVWVPGAATAAPLTLATRSGLEALDSAGYTWSALAWGRAPGALGHSSALAAAFGGCVLVAAGIAAWRTIVGGVVGLLLGVVALQEMGIGQAIATLPWHWHLVTGGFAFGLVFLATDPVTSTTSNAGRVIYGLFIGVAVATIRIANPAHEDGVILALLLANVTAPLIDWVAGRAQYRIGLLRSRQGE